MKKIFNKYKSSIDFELHQKFIQSNNLNSVDDVVRFILNKFNLCTKSYIGNLTNINQYNELIKHRFIRLTGDFRNDAISVDKRDLAFVIFTKNLPQPAFDRPFTLYYKNEHGLTPAIVDEYEFILYYKIIKFLIDCSLLQNFNCIRIICHHSSPEYINDISGEKILREVGPKQFEILTSVFTNTALIHNSTLNFAKFKSRAILTPSCYEISTCPEESTYEKYNYCSFDFNLEDKINDVFLWKDNTITGFRDRYSHHQKKYTVEQKLCDFVQCVLNIDKTPLCI